MSKAKFYINRIYADLEVDEDNLLTILICNCGKVTFKITDNEFKNLQELLPHIHGAGLKPRETNNGPAGIIPPEVDT